MSKRSSSARVARRREGYAADTQSDEWLHEDVLATAPDEGELDAHRSALREAGWSDADIAMVYPPGDGAGILQRQDGLALIFKSGGIRWRSGETAWSPTGPAPGRFKPKDGGIALARQQHIAAHPEDMTPKERRAAYRAERHALVGRERVGRLQPLMVRHPVTGALVPKVDPKTGKPVMFMPTRTALRSTLAEHRHVAELPVQRHPAPEPLPASMRPDPILLLRGRINAITQSERPGKRTSSSREPLGVGFGVSGRHEPDRPDRTTIRSTLMNVPSVDPKGRAAMLQRLLRHYNVTFNATSLDRAESVQIHRSAKGMQVTLHVGRMRKDGFRQDELFSHVSNAVGQGVDYALGRALNRSWKQPYSSRPAFKRIVAQDIAALPKRVREHPSFQQWITSGEMHATVFAESVASLYGGAVKRPGGRKANTAQYGAAKIGPGSPYRRDAFRALFPRSSAAVLTALKKRKLVPKTLTL